MTIDGRRLSASLASVLAARRTGGTHLTVTEHGIFLDGLDRVEERERGTRELLDKLAPLAGRRGCGMTPALTAERGAGRAPAAREWIGLGVLALACLLYVMDLTVLHLAIPSISEDLQPSSSQLLWIIDIYGFMVAGFLVTMGTLGDRIGRRKLLLIGAAAFGDAVVLFAAFATTAEMLIVSRAAAGHRRRDPRPVDPVAHLQHVPGPRSALPRGGRLDLGVLRGQRHRPDRRRRPARALLVGLGVPHRHAGDGACCSSSGRSSCPSTRIPNAGRLDLVSAGAVAGRHPRRRSSRLKPWPRTASGRMPVATRHRRHRRRRRLRAPPVSAARPDARPAPVPHPDLHARADASTS